MIKAGIVGCLGHTGEELISILLKHPKVKINYLSDRVDTPKPIAEFFPEYKNKLGLTCLNFDASQAVSSSDIVFLALPHTVSMKIAPLLLSKNMRVIDLSADYRIKDCEDYQAWYKVKHTDTQNIKKSVYGLPEIYPTQIKKAKLLANPGCYPTAFLLAIAPLFKKGILKPKSIIIDAKSGYSGAGKKPPDDPFWSEIKDNFKAYKVDSHQHLPEITQELKRLSGYDIGVTFVPHLLPVERGILESVYMNVSKSLNLNTDKITAIYKSFYRGKPFVRIKDPGEFPQLKDVVGTNFCDIGIKAGKDKIIIISAIDNLVKGASGQAVQNMNLMCGFSEEEGLSVKYGNNAS